MKISILTATYNRCNEIEKLYNSLVVNKNCKVDFEWLIMDDGSTDKTKMFVENFQKQNIIDIKYFYQKNKGKMSAINNLMPHVTGEYVMDCDSDDYLTIDALNIIEDNVHYFEDPKIYALAFLKKNTDGKISGKKFENDYVRTEMFTLYFKENMTGEKVLLFKSDIRKQFQHELEADEKFVTEARMYHKMDLEYSIIGINKVIQIGDYQEDGYTKNIVEFFKKAPLGYYEYFKEILELDLKDVPFSKKMYIYKHYILFATLAAQKNPIKNVVGFRNKMMIMLLWIPGVIKTKQKFNI